MIRTILACAISAALLATAAHAEAEPDKGDGLIGMMEIARMVAARQEREAARLDADGDGVLTVEEAKGSTLGGADRNRNGIIEVEEGSRWAEAQARKILNRLDRNGDGFIDRAEANASLELNAQSLGRRLSAAFAKADSNRDDTLSPDEIDTALKRKIFTPNAVGMIDKNGDGTITREEIENASRPDASRAGDDDAAGKPEAVGEAAILEADPDLGIDRNEGDDFHIPDSWGEGPESSSVPSTDLAEEAESPS